MSDIHGSFSGRRGDAGDRLHDPLYQEQLKRAQEGAKTEEVLENPASKLFHYATALFNLKKFIGEFAESRKIQGASLDRQKAIEDLTAFKAVLEELAHFDRSHEPEYTQRLSLLWLNLYENCAGLDESLASSDDLTAQILDFVREITHYPPGEDHTLGYYLSEHAGQDWIPFPFMNLLADLHEQHQSDPAASQLSKWIHSLSSMIGIYER